MLCLEVNKSVTVKSKLFFPQECLQCVSESGEGSQTLAKVPRACSPSFCSFAVFNKTGKRKDNFSLLKCESYILKQLEIFLMS